MQNEISIIQRNVAEKGEIFNWEQLQQSKKILESLYPKIIVVCNRLAGEFMGIKKKVSIKGKITGEWMNLQFIENDDYCLWNGIPVIFSVQLNSRYCKSGTIEKLIEKIVRIKKTHNI